MYQFIFSTTVLIRRLWQLKTAVFLHWCLLGSMELADKIRTLTKFQVDEMAIRQNGN
jgi:hypothetical protein